MQHHFFVSGKYVVSVTTSPSVKAAKWEIHHADILEGNRLVAKPNQSGCFLSVAAALVLQIIKRKVLAQVAVEVL